LIVDAVHVTLTPLPAALAAGLPGVLRVVIEPVAVPAPVAAK
jgi:hypothetical protein